jgi:hypothetical protein
MFLNQTEIFNANLINTIPNSVYKQLLYLPVRTNRVSFSTNNVGPCQLIKAVVSRYRSAMVHATAHTRERWHQYMKHSIHLIFLLILLSCSEGTNKEKAHFRIIEITELNGWTGGLTVQIDSLGIITKCKYHVISKIDSAICCLDTLDHQAIVTLNNFIDKLKLQNIDTLYDKHCQDCGGFFVKVSYDHKLLETTIIDNNDTSSYISKFAHYVTNIMIDRNLMDSIIVFETTKFIIPPPPPLINNGLK